MTSPFSYDGKRVIVTGAASGMGKATVAMLEQLGASTRFQAGVQAARRGWL